MLPSTYQIRIGIRKAPWLIVQGVMDGGTWWWKPWWAKALPSAVSPSAAVFPYLIAVSPTGKHHSAECHAGGLSTDGYQRPRKKKKEKEKGWCKSIHWSPRWSSKKVPSLFFPWRIKQIWEGKRSGDGTGHGPAGERRKCWSEELILSLPLRCDYSVPWPVGMGLLLLPGAGCMGSEGRNSAPSSCSLS